MNRLIRQLEEMNTALEQNFGVWCCPRGGVGISITDIAAHCGARVIFDGSPRPSEGCRAVLVTPEGYRATLTQQWHGDDNCGDWWWVL